MKAVGALLSVLTSAKLAANDRVTLYPDTPALPWRERLGEGGLNGYRGDSQRTRYQTCCPSEDLEGP